MRTILLGLDAFDPKIFERLHEAGRLPNLSSYISAGGYSRFAVANPPQSEVSWTSIATGLNPGGHGMFDFVHRDPSSYSLIVSLLPTGRQLGGTRFIPPFSARTIFDQAVDQGYPSTLLWWPAMFPARRESPVRSLPGLGTPDILGRLGVGTFFSSDGAAEGAERKIPFRRLNRRTTGQYESELEGPARKKGGGTEAVTKPFSLEVLDEKSGRVRLGGQSIPLQLGQWSEICEVTFKVGLLFQVHALTRFILTQVEPVVRLYALALQLHPLHSHWPYGTPPHFVKDTWRKAGPFLTLGWPQDTTALEEGYISDGQFLTLCDSIVASRERALIHHLDKFGEGLLGCVFDTLDRVQHMFLASRPDIVELWYEKLDGLVGRLQTRLRERGVADDTRLLIMSDHGFAPFHTKVHLNRWLIDRGYLVPDNNAPAGDLKEADWSQSQAYAVGLNSIYLNLAGREREGQVRPEGQAVFVDRLCRELETWCGPDGEAVVARAVPRSEAFEGPLSQYGPDIVVGYAPGYRASQKTGLGAWEAASLEQNRDHWAADHCINPAQVPGVIFANAGLLANFPSPSYRDIPAMAIDAAADDSGSAQPPAFMNEEDQRLVEERLKGLGYL
jgi:predicted AlkP superfamily phosphohydrolase/phosphomutase